MLEPTYREDGALTIAGVLQRAHCRSGATPIDMKLDHIEQRARAAMAALSRMPEKTVSALREIGVDPKSDDADRDALQFDLRLFLERVAMARTTAGM